MAETAAKKEYSATEVATHATKDSTWLVIKDMNDGGEIIRLCIEFASKAHT